MKSAFNKLGDRIKEISKDKPVYFYAFHGNWGDALIRAGTLKFFNEKNIKIKELTANKKDWVLPLITGGTVIYQGSGAFCKYYSGAYSNVKKLESRFNVIILPATFDKTLDFKDKTLPFRRDNFESKQYMQNTEFCHDMAFYLGKVAMGQGQGSGYFFRQDAERLNKTLPENNRDISAEGTHFSDIAPFFKVISEYEIIYTDRLHVGIAACLLGKELHLYPNAYFKNRAIFDTSIKDHFQNVCFHNDSTKG